MKKIFTLLVRLLTWQNMIDGGETEWKRGGGEDSPTD